MAEILPQVSPFTGNKYADWGGPWGAPSTNDLINFGSLLKDNWGTIKSQGPGVIKSYAEDLNPMNYIDLTPVKQFFPRQDRGLEEQPIWNPEKPESEWEMPSLEFDLERTGLPEGQSWFQRAMERLIPAASAETFLPSEPMDIPGIMYGEPTQPMYPIPSFTQKTPFVHYPDYVPPHQRVPHYKPYPFSMEDKPGSGEFSLGAHRPDVSWRVPDTLKWEYGDEGEFVTPPPPPPVTQDRHPDRIVSSSPPQTPQVVGGEDEPTKTQSQTTASRMARAVKKRQGAVKQIQEEGKQALANIEAQSRQREFERQNAIRGLAEATAAAERQRQQQRDSAAALKSMRLAQIDQRDPYAFEDRRGGRR